MNKYLLILCLGILLAPFRLAGQNKLPPVSLQSLDGQRLQILNLENQGHPMVICIWAVWCTHCHQELENFHELYDQWQEETGVKIIAISIDDSRTSNLVRPFVSAKGWNFDILLDTNGDFQRAMNISSMPFTVLLNGEKEIVWMGNSYAPGDEYDLYELILANKK